MGATISADTRRISFDNSCCNLSAAIVAERCLDEESLPLEPVVKQVEVLADDHDELEFFPSKKVRLAAAAGGDDYWLNRVDHLQKAHQNINKIIEHEYENTIASTNKLLPKPMYDQSKIKKATQLNELKTKVLKCYQDNPQQSLVCSSIVQAFNKCVAASRIEE